MKTILLTVALLMTCSLPVFAQQLCNQYSNGTVYCQGTDGSSRIITPMGRNGGIIMDDKGNLEPYTIMRDQTDQNRRDEERRRALIYGDDRRDNSRDSRSRYRYDEDGR